MTPDVESKFSTFTWGSTAEERAKVYPCDKFVPKIDAALFRAVSIRATPPVVAQCLAFDLAKSS